MQDMYKSKLAMLANRATLEKENLAAAAKRKEPKAAKEAAAAKLTETQPAAGAAAAAGGGGKAGSKKAGRWSRKRKNYEQEGGAATSEGEFGDCDVDTSDSISVETNKDGSSSENNLVPLPKIDKRSK